MKARALLLIVAITAMSLKLTCSEGRGPHGGSVVTLPAFWPPLWQFIMHDTDMLCRQDVMRAQQASSGSAVLVCSTGA